MVEKSKARVIDLKMNPKCRDGSSGTRPRRVNPSSRRSRQREIESIRSSLQTIESMGTNLGSSGGAASYQLKEDDYDESDNDGRDECTNGAVDALNSSFSKSLAVSFPAMNEQELSHLRKWNRRLQRTEVFDKYYFPEKWEQMEMNDLIDFLNIEDPLAKARASRDGGLSNSGGRQSGKSRRLSRVSGFQDPPAEKGGLGRLATSLTSSLNASLNASSEKITKLVNPKAKAAETKQQTLDPVKATKQALTSIFFPYVHDPKSVLLKRDSVFLYNKSLGSERELMLFSNGFLLADLALNDVFRMFLSLSDREFVTEKSFLDYLRSKFKAMDEDRSGGKNVSCLSSYVYDALFVPKSSLLTLLNQKSQYGRHSSSSVVWGCQCVETSLWLLPSDVKMKMMKIKSV